ncbi:Hypothetical predicted protein [Paramuricea clavata]|uniref:Uncharacterized protein n=1 Tax=Paramuricea clavata TaxID=317549 RepID=A0A6S7G005_PARCT|nr:Hypothetical predicted protein [Paramuricea clavata]
MAQQDILLGSAVVRHDLIYEVPVVAMNNSDAPIKLYKGTTIGQLTAVQVESEREVTTRQAPVRTGPVNVDPVAVDLNNSCLTSQQKCQVINLLRDYRDVFANTDSEVGRTDRTKFKINTGTNLPVALKLRRTPLALRPEVDWQIKNMEERGVICKSSSSWSSPIPLVPQKDETYRFCADTLNDVTKTEIFPLPSIRECLDSLCGSIMFSTLDLHSGYWQIEIDHKDRHKTAFTTESGHW